MRRFPTLVGLSLLSLTASACGPITGTVRFQQVPAHAAGCSIEYVKTTDTTRPLNWQADYVVVGGVGTRRKELTPEVRAAVDAEACKLGGDLVLYDDGYEDSWYGKPDLVFSVLRALTEEEKAARFAQQLALIGGDEAHLRQKVAIDTGCPAERVQVLRKREELSTGDYVVDACGTEAKYSRTGSVFQVVPAP